MPASLPASTPGPAGVPRLADGVELLGEYQDSGYRQPPSLVRRADGQVIQMSALLYRVTCRIDGSRDPAAIAELVSEDLGRTLTADQVRLPDHRQAGASGHRRGRGRPGRPAGGQPAARAAGAGHAAARTRRQRRRDAAAAAVPVARRRRRGRRVLAVDYWLFAVHGLGAGFRQILHDPVDLLFVLGLSVLSAAFHECGHATGCRYGGARPGRVGVGIYLVWPSFFTNVTDSYRLSRAGRLRTDLGGLYFNAVFMLALAGLYAATSAEILLLVIAFTHLEMLEQLLPFVRFDGYYILSDLVGVPDLFARITPLLRSALPGGRRDPRVAGLRRRARIVVTGWVLCVIPLLMLTLGYLLLHLPQAQSGTVALRELASPPHGRRPSPGHRYAMAAVDAIGAALISLSLAGTLYIVTGMARRPRSRACAGPPTVPPAASWPPRPPWPASPRSPPSGPCRASSAAGSRPARHLPRVAALA